MEIRHCLSVSLMTASLFVSSISHAHDEATAHYLGNEGVMVVHGDTKILFDAFYASSYGQYALVPEETSAAMLAGEAPYDGVDAIFVSHVHGDHFTAEPAIAYLRSQPGVHLYGTRQVVTAILETDIDADDPLMARVHEVNIGPDDEAVSMVVDDLEIDVVAIPHSGNRPSIQNYAWRVTLDDELTVMHLGDAGTIQAHFDRHAEHFAAKKTDAAFPPYWFIGNRDGEKILTNIIDAEQVIGIHVPIRAAGNGDSWRAQAGGDLFTDPGETRSINLATE